jgi:hypothetical protein
MGTLRFFLDLRGRWRAIVRGWAQKSRKNRKDIQSQSYRTFLISGFYLRRKVLCLFCTYEIHRTGMLQITFLVILESSQWEGVAWAWFHDSWKWVAWAWFHDSWTSSAKVLEILYLFFLSFSFGVGGSGV